jgi:predicted Zn-dependent protease
MQDYFFALADFVAARLTGNEGFLLNYSGERSQFVRFNRSAIRQPGTVAQGYVTLELFSGQRHASSTVAITETPVEDQARLAAAVIATRSAMTETADDPHFLVSTDVQSNSHVAADTLPPADAAVDAILRAGKDQDLVGFYAAGPVHAGFANSYGQRNWHTVHAFNFDACFYLQGDPRIKDRAVKLGYGGMQWDNAAFAHEVNGACARLGLLARDAKTLTPGGYRVFLAPAAMEEIMSMLCWDGFSGAAHHTATTPLLKMINGERLSSKVSITENIADGLAPAFQGEGFVRPGRVPLIVNGAYAESLTAPRTAAEFGGPHNGAEDHESPLALDMAPGTLADDTVLQRLGTGVYIGNLWYLNYSDRNACRMTGMTRFASFWVEDGAIVAPINVMRFDDSAYRFLGANLIDLTAAREWRLSTDTYDARATRSMHLPGALVEDFRLTL